MGAPPSPPPPQFAALTQKDRQKRTAPQAFVFEDGKIEIVRVRRKSDIPTDEAAAATIIKPGSHGGVSKVTQPGVYIFYGDIDVHVGDLDEYDEWSARFESQGGDIQKAVSELSVESARGPPSTRKVYVIGRITSVVGPDLHGMSSAHVIAIDLSVRAERQRQYEQQQSAYDAKKEEYHQAQERAREAAERAARESYEHPVEHPIEVP